MVFLGILHFNLNIWGFSEIHINDTEIARNREQYIKPDIKRNSIYWILKVDDRLSFIHLGQAACIKSLFFLQNFDQHVSKLWKYNLKTNLWLSTKDVQFNGQ
jgi:hypothetical protein